MKHIVTLLLACLGFVAYSQSPQRINYQGAARNGQGQPLANKTIKIRFELIQNSNTVFTEDQSLSTNNLGLFTTRIGDVNTTGLGSIDWEAGNVSLKLGIDTANGTNFVDLGTQQLVSAPYAMHAQSVPSTYTNNVLTIGNKTYTMSPSVSSSVDIQPGTNVSVNGTSPNYTISSTPTLNILAPGTLSISGGNTVDINPAVSFTNNVLTVGSNTVSVVSGTSVATPNTSLNPLGGGISISSTGTNSFDITVPATTITPGTNVSVSGTHPNFTVSSTPTLSLLSGNTLSISGGNSVALPGATSQTLNLLSPNTLSISNGNSVAIAPTLTLTGNVLTVGPNTNTVALPTQTAQTLSLLSANSLSISNGNSVAIAPTLSLSTSGGTLSVGAGSNSVNIAPVLTPSGAIQISGVFPNYTIYATPAGTVTVQTTTVTGTNLANVTSTATNVYNVDVPAPVLTNTGSIISLQQGTAVSTITVPVTSYTSGTGISIISGSIINSSPDQTVNLYSAGAASVTGTYPNYTVNAPAATDYSAGTGISITSGSVINTAPNQTVNLYSAGAATVSGTYPNYTVNAPAATDYSAGTGISITSGSVINTAPNQTVNLYSAGAATVLGTYPNYTVNSGYNAGTGISITSGSVINTAPDQTVSILGSGATTVSGTYPNFTVNSPTVQNYTAGSGINITAGSISNALPDQTVSILGSGATTVSGTYPNFTVNSPTVQNYTAGSGINITGGLISNALPDQTVSILSAGATTVSGTYPNFTVNSPTVQNYTAGSGINITGGLISNALPDQTVSILSAGATTVSGTYPNFTVNSPTVQNYTAGSGINITAGSISNALPDQTVNIASAGAATVSGTYPNFTVNASPTSLNLTTNNAAAASISGASPSFTLNVPPTTIAQGGLAVVTNTLSAFTVSVPIPSYNASTGQLVSGTNSVAITPTLSFTGNVLTVGPSTNTLSLSSISPFTVSGTSIFQTTLTNSLGIGTSAPSAKLDIVETSTYTGTHLKVQNGNNANTSNLSEFTSNGLGHSMFVQNNNATTSTYAGYFDGGLVTRGKTNGAAGFAFRAMDFPSTDLFVIRNDGNVGIGTNAPTAKLFINNATASTDGISVDNTNTSNGSTVAQFRHYGTGNAGHFEYNNASNNGHALMVLSNSGSQYAMRVLNTSTVLTAYSAMIEGGLIARGKNNTSTGYAFKAQETGGSDLFVVRNDGNVGIRNASPAYDLSIFNSGTFSSLQMRNGASASLGFVIGQNNTNVSLLNYENTPMYFGTNGANRMMIDNTGSVAIGGVSPGAKLDVTGNVKIADGTQGTGKILTSDANGLASWQMIVPPGAVMAFAGPTANIPSGWAICDGSQVSRTGATANLFAAIGTAWGIGDGSTTFNLPDMRGMFMRGVDGTAGNDPDRITRTSTNFGNNGNNVGSKQDDQFESHNHNIANFGNTVNGSLLGTAMYVPSGSTSTNNTGGNETRPKNVYVYYIVKL